MTAGRNAEDYSRQIAANAEVYGSDNEKIGHVAEVGAHYLIVQKGWLFIKDLYLPTSSIARVHEGHVHLSLTKQQAETMGREELPTEGDAWYGSATRTAGYETADTRTQGRTTDRAVGRAATGKTAREGEDISVPIVEEQLKAGVREKEAGTARIVKDVVEEKKTIDVPVQHEEVYVTERAVNRPATEADLRAGQREIDIPLKQQEVVTQKEAVVTGEVNIRKETVTDTERVTDTVHRQDVHVEGADSARVHTEGAEKRQGTGTGGGGKTVTDKRKYDAQGNLVDEKVTEKPNRSR